MTVDACGPMAWAARIRPVGVGVDGEQAGGVLQRPAVGDVADRLGRGDERACRPRRARPRSARRRRPAGGRRRRAGRAGRRCVRGSPGEPAEVDGEVVRDDPRLVVGDVLELVRRRDVTERPDPGSGRAQLLVDDEPAVVVHVEPAGCRVEPVGVRARGPRRAARPRPRRGWGRRARSRSIRQTSPTRSRRRSGWSTGARRSGAERPRCSAGTPPPRGGAAGPAPRCTWVTATPSAENTCAISQATNPPPMTAIRGGRASRRITVSEVCTPCSGSGARRPSTSRPTGWLPAATTTRSAVTSSPVARARRRSPVKVACAR